MPGFYRQTSAEDWQPIEILGRRSDGLWVLREVGKRWPGIILARTVDIRVPAGRA